MKKGKRLLAVSLAMVMAVSSFAGNGYVAQAKGIDTDGVTALGKSKKAVTSVSIINVNDPVLVLKKKGTYKLKIKVKATGGASKKVSYTSSKPKIVSVNSKGTLKAKKNGTAKITVKSKFDKKKKAVLTVKVGTPITKVTLKNKNVSLKVGETSKLSVTLSPKKPTRKTLSYTSDNKKVATVDKKGVIKAVAEGKAKITVKATDGSKKKAVATVTVKSNDTTEDSKTTEDKTTEGKTTEDTSKDDPTKPEEDTKIVYTENDLVWKDDFNGTSLNEKDWNYELHAPGWVNSELQEYVKDDKNVYVKDGKLVIKAIKTIGEDGNAYYTSGRVNTQGKHDFKYGKFEARVKVPQGKGFLPAFWMMPTDEDLYGQWPKCGEIDIMEVMGQTNNLVYGTIHYGEPHQESQGQYKLAKSSFTDSFHTFSCEWEPGKIRWYIDGVLYHEENDWYSAREGQGTVTYPAPFDQPFYVILNLAVGGTWVGYPDDTTSFDNAEFVVDYVKVYQKDASAYDENVEKPVKEFKPRDPDKNGNYVINGDFSTDESLTDNKDWVFMTAENGEATAAIRDEEMNIETQNQGDVDYSIQLVQAGIPFEKGATYKVSFKAKASEARNMKVAVKAPDRGYAEYMQSQVVSLTTAYQDFTYNFIMKNESDANGRIEFNMGNAGSTADITIDDVVIKKTKDPDPNAKEVKTVRADGNCVYNGSFQEGESRLGYWEITNTVGAGISVTDLKDGRRLKVVVDKAGTKAEDVKVAQSDLALQGNMKYALSFKAQADAAKTLKVVVAGETYEAKLTTDAKDYEFKINTPETLTNKDIVFYMGEKGTIYLDDVRLVEDSLIKNGSFDAGWVGFERYVDSSASASSVVDSQNEDNAADFTINDTGDADWKIQLKQSNVFLEEGKCYKLKFKIKSSIDRNVTYAIQRNGLAHKNDKGEEDWTPYVNGTVKLEADAGYKLVEVPFKMNFATDNGSIFNIAMGAVGERITTQHRICIDDISLEEIDESEMPEEPETPETPVGDNLVKNGDFSSGDTAWELLITDDAKGDKHIDTENKKAVFNITNVGTDEHHVQLKQAGIKLEKGSEYKAKFTIQSSKTRKVKFVMQGDKDRGYDWYGGEDIYLTAETPKPVECTFTMKKDTDTKALFVISMGLMYNWDEKGNKGDAIDTDASDIEISNVSLVKVSSGTPENPGTDPDDPDTPDGPDTPDDPDTPDKDNLLGVDGKFKNDKGDWAFGAYEGAVATDDYKDGKATIDITGVGTQDWNVQLKHVGIQLEQGCSYTVSLTASADPGRDIKVVLMDDKASADKWYGGQDSITLSSSPKQYSFDFTMDKDSDNNAGIFISMGKLDDNTPAKSKITLSDISIKKKTEGTPENPGTDPDDPDTPDDPDAPDDPKTPDAPEVQGENLLKNGSFEDEGNNWLLELVSSDAATVAFADNKATVKIGDVGNVNYHVKLKQSGITIKEGCKYTMWFKATSTEARTIEATIQGGPDAYKWYGGGKKALNAKEETVVEFTFTANEVQDDTVDFAICMGQMFSDDANTEKIETLPSTITISDVYFIEHAAQD